MRGSDGCLWMPWIQGHARQPCGAFQCTLHTLLTHKVPGATWSRSLLLSGSLLARFAAPLCYNFLHVIRMNEYLKDGQVGRAMPQRGQRLRSWALGGHVWLPGCPGILKQAAPSRTAFLPPHPQQMVFIAKMGSAFQDVPILGQSFNTWFPLLLVVYVLLLTFNLWEQCASKFFISEAVRFDVVSERAYRTEGYMCLLRCDCTRRVPAPRWQACFPPAIVALCSTDCCLPAHPPPPRLPPLAIVRSEQMTSTAARGSGWCWRSRMHCCGAVPWAMALTSLACQAPKAVTPLQRRVQAATGSKWRCRWR